MKVKVVTIYPSWDSEFEEDFLAERLYIEDKLVKEYGDAYHDDAHSKVSGFIDCLNHFHKDVKVKYVKVLNDGTYDE